MLQVMRRGKERGETRKGWGEVVPPTFFFKIPLPDIMHDMADQPYFMSSSAGTQAPGR